MDSLKEKTDVPWFLTMLEENHIPAEYCVGLFSNWCSCEGTAAIAEKCMDIQTKYGIDMTTVWKRLSVNEPFPNTDWTEEVDRYKEAISCEEHMSTVEKEQPVIDEQLCFSYRGYQFELSSCNNITNKAQILGLTDENIDERFPYGMFSDRYVCWMYGHKDIEGHTQEESDEPEYWSPEIYIVPEAWSYGAGFDLQSGAKVDKYVLEGIDKFLETFEE